jgi:hypothetical protein
MLANGRKDIHSHTPVVGDNCTTKASTIVLSITFLNDGGRAGLGSRTHSIAAVAISVDGLWMSLQALCSASFDPGRLTGPGHVPASSQVWRDRAAGPALCKIGKNVRLDHEKGTGGRPGTRIGCKSLRKSAHIRQPPCIDRRGAYNHGLSPMFRVPGPETSTE